MKASHHTPGPWSHEWGYIVAPDPKGIHPDIYIDDLAGIDDEGRVPSDAQQKANGRLLAAAPQLLAAARLVVERWCEGDLADAVRALDSAIAEAED